MAQTQPNPLHGAADTARGDDVPRIDLSHTVAFLLAGGQGARLHELTARECKPALHFAGRHRIVDFSMANALRSGLRHMVVATQYHPGTLTRHLTQVWGQAFAKGGEVQLRDARHVRGSGLYQGTADAVRANITVLDDLGAQEVIVLSGDHVYHMDYARMIAAHRASGASVTVAAMPVLLGDASRFGVISANAAGAILAFAEKPAQPAAMPGDPDYALASMGVYVFSWAWLRARLLAAPTAQDFGHDVIPEAVAAADAHLYTWSGEKGRAAYWRDVGTLDTYRTSSLDFVAPPYPFPLPAVAGILAGIPTGLAASRSRFRAELQTGGLHIMSPLVRPGLAQRWSVLDETVLMPGVRVSPGVRLTRCIVAPGTGLPDGLVVGEDADDDKRWFRVTEGGTTLITTAMLARRAAMRAPLFGSWRPKVRPT
jgi:glucose-1-phosphate adenylyltransferase